VSIPAIQDEVVTLCNAGHERAFRGRLDEALHDYERALTLDPACIPALFNRGSLLLRADRPADALECFDRVLTLGEASAAVHLARGNALSGLGRQEAALESFAEAIRLEPGAPLAYCNLGNALLALNRAEEALACLDRALALAPGNALVCYNRGNALLALARHAEAFEDFDRAVTAEPRFALAWYNRGNTLTELRRHAEAAASFARVLALMPDFAAAYNNRGVALLALKRQPEALGDFERALRLNPGYEGALENMGNAYHDQRRYEEAVRCFAALVGAAPGRPYALGNLLNARTRSCDWGGDYLTLRNSVTESVERGLRAQVPFAFLATSDSPAAQLRCARTFAEDKFVPVGEPLFRGRTYAHERIRVAYISADLRHHATAFLAAELFERHDRQRFETTAISFGPDDGSPMRHRLQRAFDHFLDVSALSDRDIAKLMRAREIDIAVDLQGYTADCRAGIFAQRPAPVQVSYLAYPGTLGAPYMDYLIGDRHVIPKEHFPHYSERVVHLPHCYQPNGSGRAIPPTTPTRAELSLPERAFVFCSFNGSYKITPEVFETWMRLLRVLPDSVLWLLDDTEAATRNLRKEARERGVDPARLVFAPRASLAEHLSRQPLADLFLDTLPVNAHTTASDALRAGLPVLTCQGATFAGRVASSLLHAVGLPELIAGNPVEYEKLAVALASDPERLRGLRARLLSQRESCPLFDTERYRQSLEAAYVLMWQRAENRLPPIHFAVPERPSAAPLHESVTFRG
jgi:protein O-GlcNAc transferase